MDQSGKGLVRVDSKNFMSLKTSKGGEKPNVWRFTLEK